MQAPSTPTPNDASTTAFEASNSAPGTGVATRVASGGAVALPASLMARLAAEAKDEAAKERPSVSKISLRGGVISYQGAMAKDNKLPCVIVAAVHRNSYYDKPFDPNNLQNPTCFALGVDEMNMVAHDNVPDDILPGKTRDCSTCPLSAWGSDPKGGRGKACKETRRLVVLPAGALTSAEDVLKAELAIIDIPVTSGKNYSNFVNHVAAATGMPVWTTVTDISCERDPKTQFKVLFSPQRGIMDEALLLALEKRKDEALRLALTPWDEPASTEVGKMVDAPAPAANKKAKF